MRHLRSIIIVVCLCVSLHAFSQTDTTLYSLKVRLTKAFPNGAGCGVLALATAMKYEVIESSLADLKPGSFVVLIQPCPEMLGNNFFITNRNYKTIVSKEWRYAASYIVGNSYQKEKIPLLWVRQIESITK